MPGQVGEGAQLETEARVFARYLVGRLPPPELVERYKQATAALFVAPPAKDLAVLRFVHRHPWSVSFLDAAAGFLQPGGLLRNKILLMGAVLETSPAFADEFLPRGARTVPFVLQVVALGTAAVARLALGVLLYPAASRARA